MRLRLKQAHGCLGWSARLFGFPSGCEEGHEPPLWRLLERTARLGHLPQPHGQGEPGTGPGASATHSPCHRWRGVQGLRERILKPERPGRLCDRWGRAISQEGFCPREGKRWFPGLPLSLT